ncbi:MAG: dGTPase, partial [Actinomycetota bacterium]|nr:dGTPase [Actinomycetota bacterium]
AFRQFNFERIYLRPASVRQADRVIGLLRGLVDSYVDVPSLLPADATGATADLEAGSPAAAAVAVRYVSGMTDRFALAQGVELLGMRLEALPRGV